ncbi:MAG: HAMP domain-containing sensor histidine kinase [Lachnospiraceae bacterium]|nr:HAMP domain-containing sensor histidine kinase [Lachnospiraceae bacterium]
MFQHFQLRLTALCTLVTGVILVILSTICLYISEMGIRNQEGISFQTNLNNFYQNIQMQTSLSHQWLRQTQHNYQFLVRITDNGSPLFFQSFSADETAEALLDTAEALACSQHGIDVKAVSSNRTLMKHAEYSMQADGQNYYASAAQIPVSGGVLGVMILHPLTVMYSRILKQRFIFALADLAAMILFCIFFWFFIARIMRSLQENRKKQMQFVASASHELRSPLTVILSNVDAVRQKSMAADDQFLDTIETEGKRMSTLIHDMLQLANADNHSWSMHPASTELDTLILQTFETFEALARRKELHWKISIPDEAIPRCRCDAERIQQLLTILIDNAFSYTPEGGTVLLSLKASGSAARITVSDNGPGIPDDQKKAVFQRFYCIDHSRSQKGHFGLGLCIAQEIAKLHKGQLLLADTPGGGASFTLVLPFE